MENCKHLTMRFDNRSCGCPHSGFHRTCETCGGSDFCGQEPSTPRANILNEANRLTHGPRDGLYGTPTVNHTRIANLWSAYLETPITPAQAATCMALLKIARIVASPNELDHYIDGAAYLAIAGEIATEGKTE